MRDENCIFCKILAGDIPSFKVYEDDDFMVEVNGDGLARNLHAAHITAAVEGAERG